MKRLTFIQLSDIHFRKNSGDPYDIDKPLQDAVIADLRENAQNVFDSVEGILVCGDIAFSGTPPEYEIALAFLNKVRDVFKIAPSKVYCVPGNHDVDHSVITGSRAIQAAQREIAEADKNNPDIVDKLIREWQHEKNRIGLLYEPIASYNSTFERMHSSFSVDNPNWSSKIQLNDKYEVLLYGLNSILISNHMDHLDDNGKKMTESERPMSISKGQLPMKAMNTIILSLCHHPPQCWINQNISEYLDHRVKIQLYGHIHNQALDANSQRIRIYSGALQPQRGGDWMPQYNWIQIYLDGVNLVVDIYPRVYDDLEGMFVPQKKVCDEGKLFKQCVLDLSEQDNIQKTDCPADATDAGVGGDEDAKMFVINEQQKEIIYRLYTLTPSEEKRLRSAFPEETFCFDNEGIKRIIKWIQEKALGNKIMSILGGENDE